MSINPGSTRGLNNDELFQRLIDAVEVDGIYVLDSGGHVITWNRSAELNKGYCREEIQGKHYGLFFAPEDLEDDLPGKLLSTAAAKGRCSGEGWRLRKSGERFWASYVLTPVRDSQTNLLGFVKVIRDLSERKRHEDALRAAEASLREERDRLYAAAESSLDALFFCDALRSASGEIVDFVFTYLNSNVEKIVAISRAKMLGGRMCELLPMNQTLGIFERYKEVVLTGRPFVQELEIEHEDVNSRWLRIQAVKLRDGVAITASDITQRKRDEEQILHMACHDTLTGLPNRNILNDRISQAIDHAKRSHKRVGIFLIDLDAFKPINDQWGHDIGDEVLCVVSRRLVSALRTSDSLIRVGGDEFVAIIPGIQPLPELIGVAEKILATLRHPLIIHEHAITLTCSVGISVYPDSAVTAKELLRRADTAMYASKHAGKNQFKFFGLRMSVTRKSGGVKVS